MALPNQRRCQLPGRLRLHRPTQRRHRIAPFVGLGQREQSQLQLRIKAHSPLPATTKTTDKPQQDLPRLQFSRSARNRALSNPGRGGDDESDPTMPQRQRFRLYGQPTLTLVEMRQQHLELRRRDILGPLWSPEYQNTESHSWKPRLVSRQALSPVLQELKPRYSGPGRAWRRPLGVSETPPRAPAHPIHQNR